MARRRTSAPLARAVASRSIAAETTATRSGHCASSEADAGCIPTWNHGRSTASRLKFAPMEGRTHPNPVLGSCDADGLRASQLQHAVEDVDGNVHLGHPTLIRARAQPVADHPFVA